MPALNETPADMDGLRLYVILPEFQMFHKPERYKTLTIPFAKKLLGLQHELQKILGKNCNVVSPLLSIFLLFSGGNGKG